jgi:thiol-disulfide isomerase/thioredoxin
MAVTSTMLALGTEAPAFELPDTVTGETVSISDFEDKTGLLVMFICNHCPYVKHVKESLAEFSREYADSHLGIVAISSNDVEAYPTDSPEHMKAEALEFGYRFPYLYDEDQTVAAAYTAMCTPDFFLFDDDRKLVYRGRYDESRPDSGIPVTGKDLRAAVDALLAGEPVPEDQNPSMGCSIKWKDGSTPAYFAS